MTGLASHSCQGRVWDNWWRTNLFEPPLGRPCRVQLHSRDSAAPSRGECWGLPDQVTWTFCREEAGSPGEADSHLGAFLGAMVTGGRL